MLIKPSEETLRQSRFSMKVSDLLTQGNAQLLPPSLIFIILIGIVEQIMHFYGLYQSWPKVAFIFNSMTIYLVVIQLLIRLGARLIVDDLDIMAFILNGTLKFYEREEENVTHRKILIESLKRSDLAMKAYLICQFVLFNIPNPTAWIVSWYTGEFILFTPVYLPYTDPQTLSGYIVNSAILLFFTFLVYVLFMAGDLSFIFPATQCIPMIDIYCMKLKTFGENLTKFNAEKLEKGKKKKMKKMKKQIAQQPSTSNAIQTDDEVEATIIPGIIDEKPSEQATSQQEPEMQQTTQENEEESEPEITVETFEQQFIDLVKEFAEYDGFIKAICLRMEATTFLAVSTNSFGIAMATFVALYYSKAIGGSIVLFLLFQVLMPCLMGSIMTYQKEKVLDELCGFPWYELSQSKRKIFLQFIHLCQESHEFFVTIVGELDMELFTNVMNGAYSYLMYLIEFAKI